MSCSALKTKMCEPPHCKLENDGDCKTDKGQKNLWSFEKLSCNNIVIILSSILKNKVIAL
jgi:hypothetical protein